MYPVPVSSYCIQFMYSALFRQVSSTCSSWFIPISNESTWNSEFVFWNSNSSNINSDKSVTTNSILTFCDLVWYLLLILVPLDDNMWLWFIVIDCVSRPTSYSRHFIKWPGRHQVHWWYQKSDHIEINKYMKSTKLWNILTYYVNDSDLPTGSHSSRWSSIRCCKIEDLRSEMQVNYQVTNEKIDYFVTKLTILLP